MSNIIRKARIIQDKIEYRRSINKQLRDQSYRLFLQDPPRCLPPLKKLIRWRLLFIMAGVLCMLVVSIQVMFFYDTLVYTPSEAHLVFNIKSMQFENSDEMYIGIILEYIPTVCGILLFIFWSFAATFDWAIYRRFGSGRTIIEWY
jgi:hypothetical protein